MTREEVITLKKEKRHRSLEDFLVDNEVASTSRPSKRQKENEDRAK
ncbi:3308_t:CDS:1, partial [Dentiscutata erythropus]